MAQNDIRKIQTQGVHHITIIGADRQTSIDFWEGVLGMPFIFDQPNLDDPNQGHLYFDPGDGRLITIFTNEDRKPDATPVPEATGSLHHLALNVSQASFWQVAERLDARGVPIPGRSTGASWTRSISAIRSAFGSNWQATVSCRPKATARPT
jgi:catechol 2,3-dioxygenase-like lactoylglutathione lyase family enzyme